MDFFLKSDRLGFRNWHINDFELYKSIWGDKLIAQNLYSAEPKNDDQLQEQLLHEIESVKKHGVQYWPFFLLETGELIGACGLKPYQLFEGVFELNVAVIPKYWNNGLGFEACNAMIDYTIHTLNIKSMFAGHNPQNQYSATLLKKLGFKYTHMEYYPPSNMNHASYILHADMLIKG